VSAAPFVTLRSRTLVLPAENIDTDQIIPARFLTATVSRGYGDKLFADWRYDREGRPRGDSPLDRPEARQARVLVAGRNFGCGSSREHAVWALRDFGFAVVAAPALADIFRRNAWKNGLLAFEVDEATHRRLLARPGAEVTVDLAAQRLTLAEGDTVGFEVEAFARHCLLSGMDEIDFLLAQGGAIAAYEAARPGAPAETGGSPR
jgi:3-isopropylmalate/(R)-2-methylmalate dehydratase small subunit